MQRETMPVRRFNYTGRRRIELQRVSIELQEPQDGGTPTFTVELDLSEVDLPPDAPLVIIAQRDRIAMRFPWGTAGAPTPPEDRRLVDVPVNPHFRLTALAPDGSGKLLALADQIHPTRANRRESLLWLEEKDLGQEVWRLDFPDSDGSNPTLQVNRNIPEISNLASRDDVFLAPLVPEILRSILARALLVEDIDPTEPDTQTSWGRWMGFTRRFYAADYPEIDVDGNRDRTSVSNWIEAAVAAFTRERFPASDRFVASRRN